MRWILASLIKFLFGLARERERPLFVGAFPWGVLVQYRGGRSEVLTPEEARKRGYEEKAALAERMQHEKERGSESEGL
ncbi:MAG: hypothetical protein ACE5LG_01785 [Anaerolineae bacterium]